MTVRLPEQVWNVPRGTGRRYDSDEYLAEFQERGRYPAIHDPLFTLIAEELTGRSVCDLCSSTGLLGERVRRLLHVNVVGIERDRDAASRGHSSGVQVLTLITPVVPDTLELVEAFLAEHCVDALIARRCFSELFGFLPTFRRPFVDMLRRVGVREVFLQGRVPSARSTHPMPTTRDDYWVLVENGHYKLKVIRPAVGGEVAYLQSFIAQMDSTVGAERVDVPLVPRLLDEIDAGVFNPNR